MLNNPVMRQHQVLLSWGMLALISLAAIFLLIIPALQKSFELSREIDTGYQQLSRYRQIANATPEFMAEYQRVQQQGLDKLFYPAGMTSAQVAKELQKRLEMVVRRGNGVLLSSEVVEDRVHDDKEQHSVYQQVMVKAVFQGSPALLREVLHQAYQARPLMFVESLDIKPLKQGADGKDQLVKAEVQISTYWRGGEVKNETAD